MFQNILINTFIIFCQLFQDWDFPHFVCDLDIKLPGLKQASYTLSVFNLKKSVNFPETFVFHITGMIFF